MERPVDLADQWQTAVAVREFLEQLAAKGRQLEGLEDLLEWGVRAADHLDPLSAPERVLIALKPEAAGGQQGSIWPPR